MSLYRVTNGKKNNGLVFAGVDKTFTIIPCVYNKISLETIYMLHVIKADRKKALYCEGNLVLKPKYKFIKI